MKLSDDFRIRHCQHLMQPRRTPCPQVFVCRYQRILEIGRRSTQRLRAINTHRRPPCTAALAPFCTRQPGTPGMVWMVIRWPPTTTAHRAQLTSIQPCLLHTMKLPHRHRYDHCHHKRRHLSLQLRFKWQKPNVHATWQFSKVSPCAVSFGRDSMEAIGIISTKLKADWIYLNKNEWIGLIDRIRSRNAWYQLKAWNTEQILPISLLVWGKVW